MRVEAVLGVAADELYCSKSERSSLEVALEQVSRPLSVVGLEIDDPELSETGRPELDEPCSINGTPPNTKQVQRDIKLYAEYNVHICLSLMSLIILSSPDRLLLLRVLVWGGSI